MREVFSHCVTDKHVEGMRTVSSLVPFFILFIIINTVNNIITDRIFVIHYLFSLHNFVE